MEQVNDLEGLNHEVDRIKVRIGEIIGARKGRNSYQRLANTFNKHLPQEDWVSAKVLDHIINGRQMPPDRVIHAYQLEYGVEASRELQGLIEGHNDVKNRLAKVKREPPKLPSSSRSIDVRTSTVDNLIGVILPDSSNPFFSAIGFSLEGALRKKGFHLMPASSGGDEELEDRLVDQFRAMSVRGLIYIPARSGSELALKLVASGDIPFLVFDRPLDAGSCDFIGFNSEVGTQSAVDYLVALGHRHIGYLSGPPYVATANERFEVFVDTMARLNLEFDEEDDVFQGDFGLDSGRQYSEVVAERSRRGQPVPTAILCANDLMAIGLLQGLQIKGWKLPDQMSVVGYDNISWSEWVFPPLTTISQPVEEIVTAAVQLLTARIAQIQEDPLSRTPPYVKFFDPRLEVRDSATNPPPIENPVSRRRWLRRE